ncbi:manganese efflux pump MntP family protein [Collinsella vaginalis]|uniref:manganese efflux pump MntP n=1 Tax=Collinsella vaginalis TaxID=1870987 RepID=UPI000A2698D8|nr:manganese efflux pump MntP family protein [Collinsella vaginalis]
MGFLDIAALIEALVLGPALSMDAMAVTLSNVLCELDMPRSRKLAMPVFFAVFQAGMPVIGFFAGTLVAGFIDAYAGVVSLVILGAVGGKMIVEAVRELREPEACSPTRLTWTQIALEAVATSIDALIVGVSLAAAGKDIAVFGSAIGLTALVCYLAVLALGRRVGERFGAHAQVVGGTVLILIGLRALLS